jgi:hypothetical protein
MLSAWAIWALPCQAQSPAPSATPARVTFTMTTDDKSLEGVLRRWGAEQGWQMVFVDMPEVLITGDVSFTKPSLLQAADAALLQAQRAGYKLTATAYSNQVLVISNDD